MARPVLYTYWRSSCSWRVRIALALKSIDYDSRPVHLVKEGGEQHKEEYGALNPTNTVPTLIIDGETLCESLAIIEYLDSTRPEQTPLIPKDPISAAKARKIALMIACETQPVQNLRVLQHVEKEMGAEKKGEWAKHWITVGMSAVEKSLEGSRDFCVGDSVTVADICLVPQVYNAVRWGVDMSQFPNISRINEALSSLPAFKAAHPDVQPDAVPA